MHARDCERTTVRMQSLPTDIPVGARQRSDDDIAHAFAQCNIDTATPQSSAASSPSSILASLLPSRLSTAPSTPGSVPINIPIAHARTHYSALVASMLTIRADILEHDNSEPTDASEHIAWAERGFNIVRKWRAHRNQMDAALTPYMALVRHRNSALMQMQLQLELAELVSLCTINAIAYMCNITSDQLLSLFAGPEALIGLQAGSMAARAAATAELQSRYEIAMQFYRDPKNLDVIDAAEVSLVIAQANSSTHDPESLLIREHETAVMHEYPPGTAHHHAIDTERNDTSNALHSLPFVVSLVQTIAVHGPFLRRLEHGRDQFHQHICSMQDKTKSVASALKWTADCRQLVREHRMIGHELNCLLDPFLVDVKNVKNAPGFVRNQAVNARDEAAISILVIASRCGIKPIDMIDALCLPTSLIARFQKKCILSSAAKR